MARSIGPLRIDLVAQQTADVWPRWRKLLSETSSIPLHDHSLECLEGVHPGGLHRGGRSASMPSCR